MKLIISIINRDDAGAVQNALTGAGYAITKLATSGGFLRAGNTTFIIGVEDERIDACIKLIRDYSRKRTQLTPNYSGYEEEFITAPTEVTVGGATIFVTDIERYEKL